MASSAFDSTWKYLTFRNVRTQSEDFNHYCNICNNVMINAYISNCGCHYCKACLDRYLDNGNKECPGKKDDCRRQSLIMHHDVFPDHSANIAIIKLFTKCPNIDCGFSVEYGKMEEHLRVCEIELNECPYSRFGCDKNDNKKDKVSTHLKLHDVNHAKLLAEVIDNLRNELNFVKNELHNSKTEIRNLKRELEEKLRKESLNVEYKIDDLRRSMIDDRQSTLRYEELSPFINGSALSLSAFSDSDDRSNIGGIVWRLPNFSDLTHRSISNPKFFDFSPTFLSHNCGYTINLILYANGFAKGQGTHLYVGFCLAKGEYDDAVSWPFMGAVNISIIDQSSMQCKFTKRFKYDQMPKSRRSTFDKPVKKFNYNCGDQRFLDLQVLRHSPDLLIDDCLVVKCTVDM